MRELIDDIKYDMKGTRLMGIETTSDMLKKYAESKCNVDDCRYNQDGQCTNEDKRKECV